MGTLKEDLIKAKALIDTPEKWGKGKLLNETRQRCAIGAVEGACLHKPRLDNWDATLACRAALRRAAPSSFEFPRANSSIAAFNDHPDTTHADIMALFDRAIEEAE